MDKYINLKGKDKKEFKGRLKLLDETYINEIMKLQKHISEMLENKEWYFETSKEEFLFELKEGKVIGCFVEGDRLVALGVYISLGYEAENYGYDMELPKEDLLKVGQIEATFVHEDFRGNGLQRIICEELESIARKNNKIIAVTVHPDNTYSLNTFKKLGYTIEKEKIKYGGLRRFILKKYL
ncbi:Acetyltransferase (GNAT) family protein [Clostridium sp. DSM 8431]|uniref:GNAT family N-acetyltransferase n=1 Tax=Clostridium sp. DSM 8431 TaxID=1761781 RepID=UPI0008EE5EAF|nr:GNAT family N-acetyltransferase [Clostridium sp. DSM 8431]SFU51538.1 Acetyltransferase (GNAT) family protein [Clostridium sp. DSM 8431]